MKLTSVAAGLCVALIGSGCQEVPSGGAPYLVLNPILDSLYVGDAALRPTVTYYDGNGGSRTPAATEITWQSTDPTVFAIDSLTGRGTALKRGVAVIIATVQSARGEAIDIVSNPLDLTLLLDTIYALAGDTGLRVPVAVKKLNPPAPVVWYQAPSGNGVYAIDSATGRLTAISAGGPVPYVVHADTIADTGVVNVLPLTDTTGGKLFFSVLGTVVSHVGGSAAAVNYRRRDGTLAFRLLGTHPSSVSVQDVQVTLPSAVSVAGAYSIDSLSPTEAGSLLLSSAADCVPPRPWASWSSRSPSIVALSRPGGTIVIRQIGTLANGQLISGSFVYTAQRIDLYSDPLGLLVIHGSFVAPLTTDRTTCP